ncbi:MAG: hypothetical protein KKG03_02400 [Gammaproteobacteria bacterium]|jgi:hypothetical protein|nr:hypothetical protein [Gammaproteobacteria bacterium]MBU4046392.1 hypothetical protein [Gammaproteobacteria bacterium]MBU4150481.1 hypothetical protein [Gammaproteobacteria bacterium]
MVNIYLTTDPHTHRALYDSESRFMGLFHSMRDAYEALGDLLNFCSIRSAS